MKKTYISPIINVVVISQVRPIAGSITTSGATFYNTNATGEGMTREDNSWDIWGDDDYDD